MTNTLIEIRNDRVGSRAPPQPPDASPCVHWSEAYERLDVRIRAVRLEPGGSRATLSMPGGHTVELALAVPGLHNVRNAAAALAVLHALGADVQAGATALTEFRGVGRRFERLGEAGGITVVDDYAHHPEQRY